MHGVVIIAVDPRDWVYPFLSRQVSGTSTGEAVLVSRDGEDAVYLSPLRFRPEAPLTVRLPLDTPGFTARAALEGDVTVGSFVDYRGVRVLASGRRLPPSPWALVVKVDEEEVLADFRRRIRQTAVGGAAVFLGVFGVAWGLWQRRERVHASALARGKAHFAALLDEANDAILVLDPDGRIRDANRRAEEIYGCSREELFSQTLADIREESERAGTAKVLQTVVRDRRLLVETRHRRTDGSTFPVEVSLRAVDLPGEAAILAVVRDITERKRAEDRIRQLNRLLRTISEINQLIVHSDDKKTLLAEACRVLVEHGGFRMAWIGFADALSGRVVPEARAGEGLDYLDGVVDRFDDAPDGHGPAGAAIRTGRRVVVADVATDPAAIAWRERHLAYGLRSAGSFPFSVRGEVTGALTVHQGDVFVFDDEETTLLDELADDLGYALEVFETRDEHRRAEEALRQSEERLRLAHQVAQIGSFEWDIQSDVNRWSPELEALYGLPPGGFPGTNEAFIRLVHPEDLPAVERCVSSSFDKGTEEGEWRVIWPDGTVHWMSGRWQVFKDESGNPLRMVGVNIDITGRKRTEEALAIQGRIAAIFATVPDEEMYNEVLKVILDVMESPFGVFGFIDEDGANVVPTMTRQIWDKCQVPEKSIRFPRETWGDSSWPRAIREKKTFCINEPSTIIPEGHVGIQRHISLPILFRGEAIGLFQVANRETDYTEADVRTLEAIAAQVAPLLNSRLRRERVDEALRKLNIELEERVRQRTAQLETSNKELEAFSYSVSHDLRAPLRAVDGFSRILLEDHSDQLDAEGKRLFDVVRTSTRQMGQLIDDLLSFSRVGRQEMARTVVDMELLATAAFRDLLAAGKEVSFTVGPLPHADVDPSLMRQVWTNLISNALKFTRPRANRAIGVGARTEPGRVVYWVKDNGVGFDMAYAHKLFGVFQRLHSSHEFEGTGVGLALVQRIVHRHGGEVWGEGKVGEGATFSFSLPRQGGPP